MRRATLELEVGRKQGEETVRKVIDAVDLAGGFVESTDQSGGRARLTVRVPSDQFAATLDRLKGLGKEHGLEVHGQDVTGAVTDVEARLRNLRAQEAILLELMGKAVSIGDSIAVQQQLSQNQEQIEQLEGQRRVLADQTTYATLVVAITPQGVPAAGGGSRPTLSQAWNDGVEAALAVVGGVLVVLGALLPIAMLAGWRRWSGRGVAPASPAPFGGTGSRGGMTGTSCATSVPAACCAASDRYARGSDLLRRGDAGADRRDRCCAVGGEPDRARASPDGCRRAWSPVGGSECQGERQLARPGHRPYPRRRAGPGADGSVHRLRDPRFRHAGGRDRGAGSLRDTATGGGRSTRPPPGSGFR